MDRTPTLRCALCETKDCRNGRDCFASADSHRAVYQDERLGRLHRAASAIEARHYCKEPRVREIILFAEEMGFRKLGLAFCIGLAEEARVIHEIFSQHFEMASWRARAA